MCVLCIIAPSGVLQRALCFLSDEKCGHTHFQASCTNLTASQVKNLTIVLLHIMEFVTDNLFFILVLVQIGRRSAAHSAPRGTWTAVV